MKRKTPGYSLFWEVVKDIVMLFIGLTTLIPFLHCLAYSFSDYMAIMTERITIWPKSFTLLNYSYVFNKLHLIRPLFISVARTILGSIFAVTIIGLAAYAISRPDLPGKRFFSLYLLIPMYIGGGMIPTYVWMFRLGLVNSFWVYILPMGFTAYHMLLMRSYFETIPEGLEESALLDGANSYVIFLKIVVPVSLPIVYVVMMYNGVRQWNEYKDAMLYITRDNLRPLQNILQQLVQENFAAAVEDSRSTTRAEASPEAIRMATMIVTVVPILCVFPLIQKHFVQGIMLGAVKA